MYAPWLAAPVKGLPVVVALALLAGCFGPPDIPDDAVQDTDQQLPGLQLSAWTEQRSGRLQLFVVVTNDHDDGYWYRVECGHPWNVTLEGSQGAVQFRQVLEPPACGPRYEILQPKQHLDSMWSWDFRDHEPETQGSTPVPDGNYTWTVAFGVRDVDAVLAASFAVAVENGALADAQAAPKATAQAA